VTLGLCAGGRFPAKEVLPYAAAQVVGAIIAAYFLLIIASGSPSLQPA
jgi:aquaporin Z